MSSSAVASAVRCVVRLGSVIALVAAAAMGTPALAQPFQHIYNSGDADRATSLIATNDGGYVVVGMTSSVSPGAATVMKFDAAGSLQWDSTISTANSFDAATDVVQSSLDDGYVIVGTTAAGPTPGGDILIIKIDDQGNQEWERHFPGTATLSEGARVIETAPGRFVIAGYIQGQQVAGPLPFEQAPFLASIDSTGSLDWANMYREVTLGIAQHASFSGVRQTNDGGYIATGYIAEHVWGSKSILLMKLAADGSFQWAKQYGFTNFTDTGDGIELAANGDYLITGFSKEIGEGGGTYLLRTDSAGNIVWFQTYQQFATSGGVRETSTGDIIVAGATRFTVDDPALMLTDAQGVPHWAMAYADTPGASFGMGHGVVPEANGYVMAGQTNAFNTSDDILFLRTDANGETGCREYLFDPEQVPHTLPVVDLDFDILTEQSEQSIVMNHATYLPRLSDLCQTNDLGACCWRDPDTGFFNCDQTTASDCASYPNPTFLGVGVSCTPSPCPNPTPVGACCYTDADGTLICDEVEKQQCVDVLGGTYFGDGTLCTADLCEPPAPTGACCHTADDGSFMCSEVTERACKSELGGTYLGDAVPCDDDSCQPTGACCFQKPGADPSCIVTTEAECLDYPNGTYMGDDVPCTDDLCGPFCTTPPYRMSGWWPLDETGGTTAHELIVGNDGVHLGGPTPVPGKVDNALSFTEGTAVEVPNSPILNPGTGDMSIDAWVRTTVGQGYWPIVTKYKPTTPLVGWGLSLNSIGRVEFHRADGSTSTGFGQVSGTQVNDGEWHHIAITVDRSSTTGMKFYVDGQMIWATDATMMPGSWSNNAPLYIGARETAFSSHSFEGEIDEVEFFRRILSPAEISDIYEAGPEGKCKLSCRVPKTATFCKHHSSRNVIIPVCNNTPYASPFQLDMAGLPAGSCSINGPTTFNVIGPNPVVVPPYSCTYVTVNISRPAGMNSLYQTSCYNVTITNLHSNQSSTCTGVLIDRRDLCTVIRWDWPIISLPVGLIKPITIQFTLPALVDSGKPDAQSIAYVLEVLGPDGMPSPAISINGAEPGEAASGEFEALPEETVSVEFTLQALEHALDTCDFVLYTSDAKGNLTELDSMLLETESRRPADLNADGAVNVSDLLILLGAWGSCDVCPEDLTGDGDVNVSDMLMLLSDWG